MNGMRRWKTRAGRHRCMVMETGRWTGESDEPQRRACASWTSSWPVAVAVAMATTTVVVRGGDRCPSERPSAAPDRETVIAGGVGSWHTAKADSSSSTLPTTTRRRRRRRRRRSAPPCFPAASDGAPSRLVASALPRSPCSPGATPNFLAFLPRPLSSSRQINGTRKFPHRHTLYSAPTRARTSRVH